MVTHPKMSAQALGAAAGVVLDGLLGEAPEMLHPVAAYGRGMVRLEQVVYADRKLNGLAYAAAGTLAAGGAGALIHRLSRRHPAAVATVAYLVVAAQALRQAATEVEAALRQQDLPLAREKVRALVGRDPSTMDEAEIVRAVVESVAENTVDAVVAPLFWTVVAGPPGGLAYRAIDTLDSMVGYRSPRHNRFGWAAAKADDLAAWIPARLTAALVVILRPSRAEAIANAVRHQAPAHPSPNAGVAEGAFAAALDLRLGGQNTYEGRVEVRPSLGYGRRPAMDDIQRANTLSRHITLALAGGCLALGLAAR